MESAHLFVAPYCPSPAHPDSPHKPALTPSTDRTDPNSLNKNAPGWNPLLASDSEAIVKAEHEEDGIPELVQATIKAVTGARNHPEPEPGHEEGEIPKVVQATIKAVKEAENARDPEADPSHEQGQTSTKGQTSKQANA